AGYLRITRDGSLRGLGTGVVTDVRGTQHGLTIAIVNIANELRGVQMGLINIARSNRPGLRVLPIFNADFSEGR
ncbi:MAG TPA: hypothetical protein VKZ41_13275, partial [Gemmatimonadales bacterium]|nr:hypothetical protein [Gemmatimonadales bacterium]